MQHRECSWGLALYVVESIEKNYDLFKENDQNIANRFLYLRNIWKKALFNVVTAPNPSHWNPHETSPRERGNHGKHKK
jgi:hypothetical protein